MVANLINLHVATDKLLLWFMLFFFFCVCELRVMVMKYILLLCYFFIDCCKLVFTCFFLFHDISVSNKVLFIKKYIYIEKLSNVIQM